MDNDDDFTFCQVGIHIDRDQNDEERLVHDIGSIGLKNEITNDHAGNQSNVFVQKEEFLSNGATKEVTFGSLSFTVMDASPSKQSSEISRQTLSQNAENPVKVIPEPRAPAARKPAPRAKVPFEKGYSQMDWLKLTRTHPDLAGLKGQSNRRLIPMDEVKQHRTEGSMWTVLKGRVYNLSPYMKFHPGGDEILLKAVGKDCTSFFNKYHAWVNAEFLLDKCLVGTLDDSK